MRPPIEESQIQDGLFVSYLKLTGILSIVNTYLTTGRKSATLKFITVFFIIWPLPYFVIQTYYIIYVSLENLTYIFLNCVPAFQAIYKALIFWFYIDIQSEVFQLFRKDFLNCIPKHKASHVNDMYKKSVKMCNMHCGLALGGIGLGTVTWSVLPGIPVTDFASGTVVRKVFGGWYPFPFSKTPWYEGVFVYEMVNMCAGASYLLLFEMIMVQTMFCLCSHFHVLAYHISTLKVSDANNKNSLQYMNDELRAIISDYNLLLRYTGKVKKITNLLVTAILSTGIVVVSFGLLKFLTELEDILFMLRFIAYLAYEVSEIVLICLVSTYLNTASSEIGFALYSSDWYRADKNYNKAVQIMMTRASQPLALTAGKIYPISVEILVGLFQFTYTISMVLAKWKL